MMYAWGKYYMKKYCFFFWTEWTVCTNEIIPPLKHIGGSVVSLNPEHIARSTPVLSNFPYENKIKTLNIAHNPEKWWKLKINTSILDVINDQSWQDCYISTRTTSKLDINKNKLRIEYCFLFNRTWHNLVNCICKFILGIIHRERFTWLHEKVKKMKLVSLSSS